MASSCDEWGHDFVQIRVSWLNWTYWAAGKRVATLVCTKCGTSIRIDT